MRARSPVPWRSLAIAATMVVFVSSVFWGVLGNAEAVSDGLLTRHPVVVSPSIAGLLHTSPPDPFQSLQSLAPRPVAMFSFTLNRWAADSAVSFHVGSLLLHLAAAAALLWVLRQAIEPRAGPGLMISLLVFAVHPTVVDTVAWTSARFELLGGLFALAAVALHIRGDTTGRATSPIAYALALGCDPWLLPLPLVLLSYDLLTRRRMNRLRAYAGVAFVLVIYSALAASSVVTLGASAFDPAAMAASLASSVGRFFAPLDHHPFRSHAPLSPLAAVLVVAGTVVACALLVVNAIRSHSRVSALIAWGSLWFVLGVAPSCCTIAAYDDRRVYFAVAGLAVATGAAVHAVHDRLARFGIRATVAVATLAGCVWAFEGWVAARWVEDWRDAGSVLKAAFAEDPDDVVVRRQLGILRVQLGDMQGAEVQLRRAVELDPSDAASWLALAEVYVRTTRWKLGLEASRAASRHGSRSPKTLYLQALCLLELGQIKAAGEQARHVLLIDPNHRGAAELLKRSQR